jgi:hypothetical protein
MKSELKIGDYVALKKPHVARYPIGIVGSLETRQWPKLAGFDGVSQIYVVTIPTDHPKISGCDTIPVWRQAKDLKK